MVESLDLEYFGRKHLRRIYRNLPTSVLYEEIVNNREGQVAHLGPIVVRTGHYADLPPEDKFFVKDPVSENKIFWSDEKNELSENHFNTLFHRMLAYMHNKEAYVQDCLVGSEEEHQMPIRIVTETAWHSLFVRSMFFQVDDLKKLEEFAPEFTIIHIPGFHAIPELDGTHSTSFVIINLTQKLVLVGGSSYAGELRQVVFTLASYLMPESVFCMRCSANVGKDGDVAIFLGREDTGKSTLAVDPDRSLIGDHAHAWSDKGLFNLEWGGYAKIMNIEKEKQPFIYECTRKFGSILENVAIDMDTRRVDLKDDSLTENTRCIYPISHIPHAYREGLFEHPKNLFLLTCDAYGVLPPIARLNPEQAVYAFLSAYTSKFKQMESGEFEPQVMFSVAFGDTMIALPAYAYAKRLMENIIKYNINCWLVNTGWSGEPSFRSERIKISHTRALIKAAISGDLSKMEFEADPVFHFEIPKKTPGDVVPEEILNPRNSAEDAGEYELRAIRLVSEFMKNFEQYEDIVPEEMRSMLSQIISIDDNLDLEDFGLSIG
ncbi:MAG: phosphoenolpyruvate carboxykinase (ATP) [Desulfobacteraceae bacterium]|jgi:phosphoenolpyruvate carboxykinase (ATP)|nr:phosphoenolpyruvate carboxykinase (ATP) [Desulfobacteraceae bacterium]